MRTLFVCLFLAGLIFDVHAQGTRRPVGKKKERKTDDGVALLVKAVKAKDLAEVYRAVGQIKTIGMEEEAIKSLAKVVGSNESSDVRGVAV